MIMEISEFILKSIFLGIALAMDAFSVSVVNGLCYPDMTRLKKLETAGTFAVFQFIMPMLGWLGVYTLVTFFSWFQKFIPWIALILLLFIGGKMIWEVFRPGGDDDTADGAGSTAELTFKILLLQGIATSIDALSVGFTISDYTFVPALISTLIIGVETFGICIGGIYVGMRFGRKLADKAPVLGGCILIVIGIEIFIKGVFGL